MNQIIAPNNPNRDGSLPNALLAQQREPQRVRCGRNAWHHLAALLQKDDSLSPNIELIEQTIPLSSGPAVLVLDAMDLHGPDRQILLAAAEASLPGRPVVIGGSDDRRILLEAINQWRAFRLLPAGAPIDAIADAIQRANEMLSLDIAVKRCAHELLMRCHSLASTVRELRATRERLLHAERLATVGRTIGALMTRMQEQADRIQVFRSAVLSTYTGTGAPEAASRITDMLVHLGEAQRCFDALLVDMMALAEARPVAPVLLEREELDALVEETVRLFRYDPLGQERVICVDCHSALKVAVDRDRLRHAILNLLRNAAQATTAADRIVVSVTQSEGKALIEVADTGEGMSPDTLEQIFTPFFTTKGPDGMGLGLRLVRATVESHGGTLDCKTTLGRGSTFCIRLPVLD